jgi:hypothetical protein
MSTKSPSGYNEWRTAPSDNLAENSTMRQIMLVLLFLLIAMPLHAQDANPIDDLSPFEQMLMAVPARAEAIDTVIHFLDLRAVEQGRDAFPLVRTDAQLELAFETDLVRDVFMAGLTYTSMIPEFPNSSAVIEPAGMREALGFGFVDIDQMIHWGNPPEQFRMMFGRFDTETIDTTLTGRDYTNEGENLGFTLYCGSAGCPNSMEINFDKVNRANPFGGQFGREEPFLVSSDTILTAPAFSVMTSIATPYIANRAQDEVGGLLEIPFYRALVSAITDNAYTQESVLRQVMFLPINDLLVHPIDPSVLMDEGARENTREALAMSGDGDMLPFYAAIGFADIATEDREITLMTMVFATLSDAELARDRLTERISEYRLLRTDEPLMALMDDIGVSLDEWLITEHDEQGLVTLSVVFSMTQPSNVDGDFGMLRASGLWYRNLYQMYAMRDLGWLSVHGAPAQ